MKLIFLILIWLLSVLFVLIEVSFVFFSFHWIENELRCCGQMIWTFVLKEYKYVLYTVFVSLCLFFSVFHKRVLRFIFLFLLFFTLTSFDIFILLFTIFYSLCLLPSFFLLSTLLSFIRMFPSFIFLLGFCNYLFLNLFFYPKQVYSNKSLYF